MPATETGAALAPAAPVWSASAERPASQPAPGGAPRPEELAGVEMLDCLPPAVLAGLAGRARPRTYTEGEAVFAEGEPGDSLHVVRRGIFKVVRPSQEETLVLQRLGPGSAFGELALLNSEPRSASVIALSEGETIELGKDDLDRAFDAHPEAVRRMLGSLARSLTQAKETVARHNHLLEVRVRQRTAELRETQLEAVRRLGQAAESRDYATGAHITRMSRMCARLARAAGMEEEECDLLLHAAAMHDVGKIAIPDDILLKPGSLDEHEWEIMKTHTTVGAQLLSGSRLPVMQMAETIALLHHERWDGSGYPRGLTGEQIPLLARICAVCDAFDALISRRPYKPAWSLEEALVEIRRSRTSQFDPELVDLFAELYPEMVAIVDFLHSEEARDRRLAPVRPVPEPPR